MKLLFSLRELSAHEIVYESRSFPAKSSLQKMR